MECMSVPMKKIVRLSRVGLWAIEIGLTDYRKNPFRGLHVSSICMKFVFIPYHAKLPLSPWSFDS